MKIKITKGSEASCWKSLYRIFIYFHVYLILNKLIRDSLKHVSKIEFKEKQRIEYLQYTQRN